MEHGIVIVPADDGVLEPEGERRLLVRTARVEIVLDGMTPAIRAALLRINGAGIAEAELVDACAGEAGAAPLLYYVLQQIARRGLLAYRAAGENGALATAAGATTLPRFRPAAADARLLLSRFAVVRRDGAGVVIESALSPVWIQCHDSRVVALAGAFGVPRAVGDAAVTASGLSGREIAALVALLRFSGALAEVDEEGRIGAEESEPLAFWEFHDLLFHTRSRVGRYRGPHSATHRFHGRLPPLEDHKRPMSEEAFALAVPDLERLRREDAPFTSVLENRHSTRVFGEEPMDRRQLGEFLYRAARERKTFADDWGQQLGNRPYPGSGALYELEIYAAAGACRDLPTGFYHYVPGGHRLDKLPASEELPSRLLAHAARVTSSNPQVLLIIAARFARISWSYQSVAYALILKDLGVLYQTMYLVAESMGLGACAAGLGDADSFAAAAGLDYYAESSVGEFLIGSRK